MPTRVRASSRAQRRPSIVALLVLATAWPATLRTQSPASEGRVILERDGWRLIGDFTVPTGATSGRRPAALLLNGAGRDRRAYARLAAALARHGVASLRLDLRGSGESTNLGAFVPFDTGAERAALRASLAQADRDIAVAHRWLQQQPNVDPQRIAIVGASFSAEAAAVEKRRNGLASAYVALSPGSFSDSSLHAIDVESPPWLIVVSARERFVQRQRFIPRVEGASRQARFWIVPDSAHATDLLLAAPLLNERIAEWIAQSLSPRADGRMLAAARHVGAWLRSTHRQTASRPAWPDDALRPEDQSLGLGNGVAGQVLFFAELHRATGDSADLRAVREGAGILLRAMTGPDTTALDTVGLYRGSPGIAVALVAVARATGERRYADAARAIATRLQRAAQRDHGVPRWSASRDVIFGDAGTGFFLLDAARRFGDTTMVADAARLAQGLLAAARPDSGGIGWVAMNGRFTLPNFSHGAAGIGTFLAAAGVAARDTVLLRGARRAAEHLVAIARRDSLGFRVPYGWPEPDGGWARPFDIGWAHGPAGTARLFWQLWEATRGSSHLAVVRESARTLQTSGMLAQPRAEFGRAPFGLTMRFDVAGAADFLGDLYDATGERTHLDLALVIGDTIRARAERTATGIRWVAPRYAFMSSPGVPGALTGYLHGAAGYGLLFLKLDALQSGRALPQRLPDNPF